MKLGNFTKSAKRRTFSDIVEKQHQINHENRENAQDTEIMENEPFDTIYDTVYDTADMQKNIQYGQINTQANTQAPGQDTQNILYRSFYENAVNTAYTQAYTIDDINNININTAEDILNLTNSENIDNFEDIYNIEQIAMTTETTNETTKNTTENTTEKTAGDTPDHIENPKELNNTKPLSKHKGEIDQLLILFVVFLGIALITTSVEPFIVRQKISQLSNRIVEEIEYDGKIDTDTENEVKSLLASYNLNKYSPTYSFSGSIMPSGKIQLRNEFQFTISVNVPLKMANIGKSIHINIPIRKTLTGRSQVYYRPSEL